MSVSLRRLMIWVPVVVLLAAGLAYSFWPQPVLVDLATGERGLLRVTIDDEGEARVREVYTLHAPLGGRLLRIEAEAGDRVEADLTELARIEPPPPAFLDVRSEAESQAAVEAARAARDLAAAEVERAEAELTFAAGEVERARRLIRQETISQRALDEAERTYSIARAELATAKAALNVREYELQEARSRLLSRPEIQRRSDSCECVPVTAPVNGEVLRVLRESEGVIEAGMPLMEIGDPQNLEIVVDLLSEDAVRIAPGQKAIVEGWGGPSLEAKVRRIEPFGRTKVSALGIEEQRVDVVLDLVEPPERWRRLGHGYRVDVRVVLFEGEVLKLPLGAVFREGDGWAVFRVEDGRARLRAVTLGERNTLEVAVESGLSEGDRVVLYPSERIADGVKLEQR